MEGRKCQSVQVAVQRVSGVGKRCCAEMERDGVRDTPRWAGDPGKLMRLEVSLVVRLAVRA